MQRRYTDWRGARVGAWAGLLLLAAALVLYTLTLDNGLQPEELVGGDLITHQYAQVQARPSNAPGYPIYTMGGWLWFHGGRALLRLLGNPLPNPIPILSSYSTLWALLALWFFYAILRRLTRSVVWPLGNWPLATLVTAFYAVTYFFWYYATTAEQYSSAIAQTLAIVYLYLLWRAHLQEADRPAPSNEVLALTCLLALLCGISLAHMLTVALIVPPLVVVMLWEAPWLVRNLRVVVGAIVAAVSPLLSYLYVYLRGAVHPEWWGAGDWQNARQWFWAFVSTAQGREELGWGFEPGRALFGNQFPELIWVELSLPILILSLVGVALLGRKVAILIYSTLAIYLVFCWAYRYGNWYQVILPAYPLILFGLAGLANWLAARQAQSEKILGLHAHPLSRALLVALGVAVLWRFQASLPAANSHNRPEDTALARAAALIVQPLPVGASLFAALEDALALTYLTQVWGIRPDLRVVSSPQAGEVLRHGQALFATWEAALTLHAELPTELRPTLQSGGPDWIRFSLGAGTPVQRPAVVHETEITPEIALVGYSVAPAPTAQPGRSDPLPALDVTLYWRLTPDWPADVALSVRPVVDGAYAPNPAEPGAILQQDRPRPAHGLLTLADRPAGATVLDAYRFAGIETADRIRVILYRHTAQGFENIAELDLPTSQERE